MTAYITPVTQAKMEKKHQALCWHESVKTLWLDVISFLSESLDVNIPVGPTICLLGLKPENVVGRAATSSVFFTVLFYTADLGSAQHLAWQSRSLRSGSTLPPSCLTPCILDSVEKH
uniref:Uncharacterized protein n=1 Tax=Gadus morhua TaxID=8049 RepID=A0A8C5BQX9_GADMO